MDTLVRDTAFALRSFARRPTFALIVIVTFGVGVGATTAIYSVADAVLLRPIKAPEADRIASIYTTYPSWRTNDRLAAVWDRGTFSWPAFDGYRARQQSFASVAAYTSGKATLRRGPTPERIEVGYATPELFRILGTRPVAGRLLLPNDPADVVVLSNSFWRSAFGGQANAIGATISLSDHNYRIVGVLPDNFEFVSVWRGATVIDARIWRPIVPDKANGQYSPGNEFLSVVGRLRSDVTMAQASAEASQLIPVVADHSDVKHGGRAVARIEDQSAAFRRPIYILVAASLILLFASCVSVAAMLLGIGLDRQAEMSVRAALGAPRRRLIRQLITEGLLLGIGGGALGVPLSLLMLRSLIYLAPESTPGLAGALVDGRVLLVSLAAASFSAMLFSLVPAFVSSGANLSAVVTSGRVGRASRTGMQNTLIIGELALATTLLMTGGLLTRTMRQLDRVDPGFEPSGLLTVRVAPTYAQFRDTSATVMNSRVTAYFGQLKQALQGIPGVQDVAIAGVLPFSGDGGGNAIEPEGVVARPGEALNAERRPVSFNYFDVMRMRFVAGRGFTPEDDRPGASRVVVVNEALARKYWPAQHVIGKRMSFWDQAWTVVGVVRDTRESDIRGEGTTKFYVPAQRLNSEDGSFVIRTGADVNSVAALVRPRIAAVDPSLPVTQIIGMRERMSTTVVEQRYEMRLILAFSALATLFAVTGVYGVLSRSVSRRRREIGIRSALGASRRALALMLLRQGAALAAAGVSLGLIAGYFGTRVIESVLYETRRNDSTTLLGISVLMLFLTLIASWQPARRAGGVDPIEALRAE